MKSTQFRRGQPSNLDESIDRMFGFLMTLNTDVDNQTLEIIERLARDLARPEFDCHRDLLDAKESLSIATSLFRHHLTLILQKR